ncbi:hypothetical protein MTO96_032918 [Rhipicephalus appendiculatus]
MRSAGGRACVRSGGNDNAPPTGVCSSVIAAITEPLQRRFFFGRISHPLTSGLRRSSHAAEKHSHVVVTVVCHWVHGLLSLLI